MVYKKNYTPQPSGFIARMQGWFNIQYSMHTVVSTGYGGKKSDDHIN